MADWRKEAKARMAEENAKVDACEARAAAMSDDEILAYYTRMIARGGLVFLCERYHDGPLDVEEMRGIVSDFMYLEESE